jgi:hypothetical protein
MAKITIENATVTMTYNDVPYVHDFVQSISINDPRENNLTVSPQGGSRGLIFRTGLNAQATVDSTVRDLEGALVQLYQRLWENQDRFDFQVLDSATGERYDFTDCIIRTSVLNAAISEGEGSFDVPLALGLAPENINYVAPEDV